MNLSANNISFAYKKNKQILNDISIDIPDNKVIGLMGDSGSGKSTLCKIITGYLQNYTGTVTIDNTIIDTKDYYPAQLIFQHPEKTMNPKWKMHKVLSESWNPPQELMDIFGLKKNWLNRWPNELSGGELQRFSILRALNPKTKFIIADEISTMLDAVTQVQIWEALLNYCKENKIGILAVSHDKNLLEVISDDIILFNDINKI
ncbi:MAG: ATP-binding cassette domain-containing protein [Methanosphaera stadtmanae]|jgi:peptide/nickel transport system ATP-binding protein|nr:ATP-binding cassette domain-containing protein [Methanosphaera stadtmanae]